MQGVPPPSAPGLDGLSRGSCDARHSYLWLRLFNQEWQKSN
jgi:hypothetical protein